MLFLFLQCFFLVCFTSLVLVDSIQYGVAQREEEEKGPLVRLLSANKKGHYRSTGALR